MNQSHNTCAIVIFQLSHCTKQIPDKTKFNVNILVWLKETGKVVKILDYFLSRLYGSVSLNETKRKKCTTRICEENITHTDTRAPTHENCVTRSKKVLDCFRRKTERSMFANYLIRAPSQRNRTILKDGKIEDRQNLEKVIATSIYLSRVTR